MICNLIPQLHTLNMEAAKQQGSRYILHVHVNSSRRRNSESKKGKRSKKETKQLEDGAMLHTTWEFRQCQAAAMESM